MSCEIVSTPGAVFALWGKPEIADMDRVLSALTLGAAACGHPVVYVTRVPERAPPPDAQVRARLDELMPRLMKACSTYHVVLEGDGFGAAVKRGILTGAFQLTWRRKTFFVHAQTSQIASVVDPAERHALALLLDAARLRGLLDVKHGEQPRPSASPP